MDTANMTSDATQEEDTKDLEAGVVDGCVNTSSGSNVDETEQFKHEHPDIAINDDESTDINDSNKPAPIKSTTLVVGEEKNKMKADIEEIPKNNAESTCGGEHPRNNELSEEGDSTANATFVKEKPLNIEKNNLENFSIKENVNIKFDYKSKNEENDHRQSQEDHEHTKQLNTRENPKIKTLGVNKPPQLTKSPVHDMEQDPSKTRLRRELGLMNCVGIIVGNMIGSGIFVSPRGVLGYAGSVGMSLAVWACSGLISMVGAFCYAELGTMIPQSGGSYTYLHEAFGESVAFLELWLSVTVFIPCVRAIMGLAFATYVLQPFFPDCDPPDAAKKLIGIVLIFTLTWINCRRVRWATRVQDGLALLKVVALLVIVVAGLQHLGRGNTSSFQQPLQDSNWHPALLAKAFYQCLWAYAGWNNLNVIMEELKDPFRNFPRAVFLSLSCVTLIYVLTNVAYFAVLSPAQVMTSDAVAVTLSQRVLGPVATVVPVFVACSIAGGLNGSILTSSRLLFVGARRGHLPKALGLLQTRHNTPVTSLVFSAAISMVMFVASDLRSLINYTAFAGNLLGLGVISAFFYFRVYQPDRPRPIKVWLGFAVLELLLNLALVVMPATKEPLQVAFALIVASSGLAVFHLARTESPVVRAIRGKMDKITYICQILFEAVHEEKEK